MKNYSIRTDLAIEVTEMLTQETDDNHIEGVELYVDNVDDIEISWVNIKNEKGQETMGKPIGNYVTIESEAMKENDVITHEKITDIFSKNLIKLCSLNENSTILIVGLGNWNVTPDALGPKVISKVLVTRHIRDTLPKEIDKGVRPVSAISPGVMGITGIETAEIVKGVVDRLKPDIVIAIDALATRKTSRINATIQMSDTGIAPGGGMGNKRKILNKETLGVPVIAIGVPTVVDAGTLVNDTIDLMIDSLVNEIKGGKEFYQMLKDLDKEEKYNLINNVLNPYTGNLFVTPKEVDATIERLAKIIANAINIAMHPSIDFNDINRYIN
ncbi:GPR endopeptidase [uncultured Tyzzerella sp.]|uniref:GPR endopeptidase n=1 Tax=uncultured Tyzzerella sp. TaxID=2321398 RepID=UPI00294337FA|nr:GPR endopeptidase [uncultured Tyzzerella sp.]